MATLFDARSDAETFLFFTHQILSCILPNRVCAAACAEFDAAVALVPPDLRSTLSPGRLATAVTEALKALGAQHTNAIVFSMVGDVHRCRSEAGYVGGAFGLVVSSKRVPADEEDTRV